VTNPPIDAIREELVTSSTMLLGSEGDLLNPRPEDCRRIRSHRRMLTNAELARLRALRRVGLPRGHAADALPARRRRRGLGGH
jgi:hypothetical protein